jgi:hypothetical protein
MICDWSQVYVSPLAGFHPKPESENLVAPGFRERLR